MKRYGIRASMDPADAMAVLVGSDFHVDHWYPSQGSRNQALRDLHSMRPVQVFQDLPVMLYMPIESESESESEGSPVRASFHGWLDA